LVEKPISNEVEEAREMVRFAALKGVYLGCNLNHYFTETADKAAAYMKEGKVGEHVYSIHKVGFNGGDSTYKFKSVGRWQRPYAHVKAFLAHPFSVMRYFGGNITHVQAFMNKSGVRKTAEDLMLSINSVHVKFEDGSIGYLISQRGDAPFGLGGWWSYELAGTKGTFCIENCVEKLHYWSAENAQSMGTLAPVTFETGETSFSATFPRRIHAYLEDVTNKVPADYLRASGRDALATLEYTFAAIESYEEGGAVVRPRPLPPMHGAPGYI
ncbi:MAG: hypothetical protein PHG48_07925, partial [Eubacteriales bacterium]|nr:hypothetical protein [Eubacteriales bacterium]